MGGAVVKQYFKRFNFGVTNKQHFEVKRAAKEEDSTMSDFLRDAVEYYLEHKEKE